jgi:hypothetical protein
MHGKIKNIEFNRVLLLHNSMSKTDIIEVRKVQALTGDRSFILVLPKQFALELGVGRGDFMKCRVDNGRLVVERMIT